MHADALALPSIVVSSPTTSMPGVCRSVCRAQAESLPELQLTIVFIFRACRGNVDGYPGDQLARAIAAMPFHRIVILTGSGISAESGLSTFRDKAASGPRSTIAMWRRRRATADPRRVLDFYNMRRGAHATVHPTPPIMRSPASRPASGEVVVVTQNVDELHERAGTSRLIPCMARSTRRCAPLAAPGGPGASP